MRLRQTRGEVRYSKLVCIAILGDVRGESKVKRLWGVENGPREVSKIQTSYPRLN